MCAAREKSGLTIHPPILPLLNMLIRFVCICWFILHDETMGRNLKKSRMKYKNLSLIFIT